MVVNVITLELLQWCTGLHKFMFYLLNCTCCRLCLLCLMTVLCLDMPTTTSTRCDCGRLKLPQVSTFSFVSLWHWHCAFSPEFSVGEYSLHCDMVRWT